MQAFHLFHSLSQLTEKHEGKCYWRLTIALVITESRENNSQELAERLCLVDSTVVEHTKKSRTTPNDSFAWTINLLLTVFVCSKFYSCFSSISSDASSVSIAFDLSIPTALPTFYGIYYIVTSSCRILDRIILAYATSPKHQQIDPIL